MSDDTNGGKSGTSGGGREQVSFQDVTRSVSSGQSLGFWGLWFGLLTAVGVTNAASSLTEAARFGEAVEPWKPYLWEATSAAGILLALPGLVWFVRRYPVSRHKIARQVFLHTAAALAFSALHITTMLSLREGIYAMTGNSYSFGPWLPGLIYELRKDLVAYLLIVTILNLMQTGGRIARRPARGLRDSSGLSLKAGESEDRSTPKVLILHDGGQSLAIDPASLLAVKAAGNYVELLRESATPLLVRATLAEVEVATRPFGFLRIHRSWIVAHNRIRQVTSTRAGDFRAQLDTGLVIPGSRRYRRGLKQDGGQPKPVVSPAAPD
ncbi:LytTR family DNA-binding domain-containing protein [Algihabitans albus]|uniref:LytTR family DNA-binding domain-containing protein n=1 Tax=Algihabitans albus TaxID=2164067 RepID=UPI0013C2E292|nr:LytTR family DNA-binding domain-containing protein [Algihabitans albus]